MTVPASFTARVSSAAVCGRGHTHLGMPCQDKTFTTSANGITAMALCDGAGSARLSHYGAETVTKTVCNLLCSRFERYFSAIDPSAVCREILSSLRSALLPQAKQFGCEVRELASTLLFTAVREADGMFLLGHLGDGVIGMLKMTDTGLAMQTVSAPDNGQFASETYFVTSPNADLHMRLYRGKADVTKDILGFVLMSDGSADSLFRRLDSVLVPMNTAFVCGTFCSEDRKARTEILASRLADICQQYTDDDCSYSVLTADYARIPCVLSSDGYTRASLYGISRTDRRLFKRTETFDSILHVICEYRRTTGRIPAPEYIAARTHVRKCDIRRRLASLRSAGMIEAHCA